MGHYLNRYWQPDGVGMTRVERMGGAYHPYIPHTLCDLGMTLEPACATSVARAQEALLQLDEKVRFLTVTEPLARIILRSEAISSSRIEGLEVPSGKLLVREELDRLGVPVRADSTEEQVLGNVRALQEGVTSFSEGMRVDLEAILSLNRMLLANTRLADYGGVLRTSQNWIGGNRVNPVGAAFVPPEPEEVGRLLDDLLRFVNESELPGVAIAALTHAQFETIHPFADGNGRTGRALVHLVLRSHGYERHVTSPVSLVLATMREDYLDRLSAYRCEGKGEAVQLSNAWVEFFSRCVTIACERAMSFESVLDDIRMGWRERTSFRANSAGDLLIDVLPGTPVVSIATAAQLIGRSYPATRQAVRSLEEAGILKQNSRNRKSGIYVAEEVVSALTTGLFRACSTVGALPTRHPSGL